MQPIRFLLLASLLSLLAHGFLYAEDSIPKWTEDEVAQTVKQLWQDYNPRKEPLNVKTVRSWQQDGVNVHYVIYNVGTFKGQLSTMAAFYTTPLDTKKKYPAVVNIHGGGQRAYLRSSVEYAQRGYCCISPNWGGRVMELARPGDLNTNWGAVDPTQADPSGYSSLQPGPKKIDPFESPRNNHWYLLTIACRRAITYLESRNEVDANRIGVLGHSMGGRLTGFVAGCDNRVKAASPSVGGSGFLYQNMQMIPKSARGLRGDPNLFQRTISGESYLANVSAPILFLSATNDFNAPMENVERGMALVPHANKRTTYAVHLNHRFSPAADVARKLWFDAHLKNTFTFPGSPDIELNLSAANSTPQVLVRPDTSQEIQEVRIYYGYDRDPRNRFWASADARVAGDTWVAQCPVYDLEEPLFVLANVFYKLDDEHRYNRDPEEYILSASASVYPPTLARSGIKATATRQRSIDELASDATMRDWYILNQGNPHHWLYSTRKLNDPRWQAPNNGQLQITASTTEADNTLAIKIISHSWRGYLQKRAETFIATIRLAVPGAHTFVLKSADFKNATGLMLQDWDGITELQFQSADKALPMRKELTQWRGSALQLHHLEWLGGELVERSKPYPQK